MLELLRPPPRLWRFWAALSDISDRTPLTSSSLLLVTFATSLATLCFLAHPLAALPPATATLLVLSGPPALALLRSQLRRGRWLSLAARILLAHPPRTPRHPLPGDPDGVFERISHLPFAPRSRVLGLHRDPLAAGQLAAHLVRADPRTLPLFLALHGHTPELLRSLLSSLGEIAHRLPELVLDNATSPSPHLRIPFDLRERLPHSPERTLLLLLTRPETLRTALCGSSRSPGLAAGEGRWFANELLSRPELPGFVSARHAGALLRPLLAPYAAPAGSNDPVLALHDTSLLSALATAGDETRAELECFVRAFLVAAPTRLWCEHLDLTTLDLSRGIAARTLAPLLANASSRCTSVSCTSAGAPLSLIALLAPDSDLPLPSLADSVHRLLCVPHPSTAPAGETLALTGPL